MTVDMNDYTGPKLSDDDLARWRDVPSTVVSDGLGRTNGMNGLIQSLVPDMPFVGQALTVKPLTRNNTALHYALDKAWPGCVMVADAEGNMEGAVWGGVSIQAAKSQRMAGVVIDGCVRDIDLLKASGVPVYCRGVSPTGPKQEVGGSVNKPITCGGVAVSPGDLIVADNDGVVVAPFADLDDLWEKCKTRMEQRADYFSRIEAGEDTHEVWNPQYTEKSGA